MCTNAAFIAFLSGSEQQASSVWQTLLDIHQLLCWLERFPHGNKSIRVETH